MMVLDIVAVAVATVAGMAVGAAWFSKRLGGKPWARAAGVELGSAPASAYLYAFVATAITATVLKVAVDIAAEAVAGPYLVTAILVGVLAWLGFTAARCAVEYLFEQRPLRLFVIDMGHQLAVVLVMSVIIGLFGN